MTWRSGIIVLDKPPGPTSREVLDAVQERLGTGALGHAGTLDPLAGGLLVALAGKARRLQEFFIGRDKTYVARVRFGATSPTLDAEGPIEPCDAPPRPLAPAEARLLLDRFVGGQEQQPPEFSALRIGGRRAHSLARGGRRVDLRPRSVRIGGITLLAIEEPDWVLEVSCGPGLYVRSLARDLGLARGSGAYLADLRRTRSGTLRVEDAVAPSAATWEDLRPLSEVLAGEPRIDVAADDAKTLRCGNVIANPDPHAPAPAFAWFRGRPCFRLTVPRAGLLRSDLMIEDPGWEARSDADPRDGADEGGKA